MQENVNTTQAATYSGWSWMPTSKELLQHAEYNMLKGVKRPFKTYFIPISNGNYIRTIEIGNKTAKDRVPLFLLHGYAAALGFWKLNIDDLSEKQNVYAIDLLGFGRSSRPTFPCDPVDVERCFVDSIEEWREKVGLKIFILVGHSLGGFLAASYTLSYPEHVKHLVLADPWGFAEPRGIFVSWRHKAITYSFSLCNPSYFLRLLGPLGPSFTKLVESDVIYVYGKGDGKGESRVMEYIYHCNVQKPSGENAFRTLSMGFEFAKNPMVNRISDVNPNIPITILYGSESWLAKLFDFNSLYSIRKNGFLDIQAFENAGHQLLAEQADKFNEAVNEICNLTEENYKIWGLQS